MPSGWLVDQPVSSLGRLGRVSRILAPSPTRDRAEAHRSNHLGDTRTPKSVAVAIAPHDHDRFAASGVEPVADNHLTLLMVSTMKLPRRRREPSSADGRSRPRGRRPSTARCSAWYSARSASRARSIGSITRSSIGWPAIKLADAGREPALAHRADLQPETTQDAADARARRPAACPAGACARPAARGSPGPAATCSAPAGTSPSAAAGRCRGHRCGRVWMAPSLQEGNDRFGVNHCSQSCVRPVCAAPRPLALMGVRRLSVSSVLRSRGP